MDRDELIEFAKQELSELYSKHKDSGILAIYIWGSITRPDFDIQTSDIDVVCIVDDEFPIEMNEHLKEELKKAAPEREWGFQIIYLDELNGGPLRSRLAKAMSPQSILPSFRAWLFVSGTDFQRSDFSVQDATIIERMQLNIEEIRRRLANIPTDDDYKKGRDRKGVVKAALLLVYNRQLNRGKKFPLDYNELPNNADDIERPFLKDLLKIKQGSLYEEATFNRYIPVIEHFAATVEQELS